VHNLIYTIYLPTTVPSTNPSYSFIIIQKYFMKFFETISQNSTTLTKYDPPHEATKSKTSQSDHKSKFPTSRKLQCLYKVLLLLLLNPLETENHNSITKHTTNRQVCVVSQKRHISR